MQAPSVRGVPIDQQRYQSWLASFASFSGSVTRGTLENWIAQFQIADRDLAARILDSVFFIGVSQTDQQLRELLAGLPGWHTDEGSRQGKWYFVPFSGSSGESGDSMTHRFRIATSMTGKQYTPMFLHRSDLVRKTTKGDTVVLIDDFSGTGTQACDAWRDVFSELLSAGQRVLVMLVAATGTALSKINAETEMAPVCNTILNAGDNIFDVACVHFLETERAKVLQYCRKANPAKPKGYGDCGLLVVFSHRCPNNSIPILYARNGKWQGLFPR